MKKEIQEYMNRPLTLEHTYVDIVDREPFSNYSHSKNFSQPKRCPGRYFIYHHEWQERQEYVAFSYYCRYCGLKRT